MVVLLTLHLVAALSAPTLVRLWGPRAFLLLASVPAATAVYAGWQLPQVRTADPPVELVQWVDQLGLSLAFRMDTLAWLMTLVVGGIGALVLAYCADYFERSDREGLGLFAGALTGFAGAMLGLVTSDDLLLLYVFWEATTILSYLLIGHLSTSRASTGAAKQALIVTTFGGLSMLVGIILIGQTQGTYRISGLLADPGADTSPWIVVGVVLLLVGAVTKSALIPFHFWLPGAMAAPTPVSAYLHAAAMVKAGVYLVARFAPAYADLLAWQVVVTVLGGATMLLGGYRALRQYDLKLLLAYGTVSQLGFMVLIVGGVGPGAALAGLTLLAAHALFKACLFLVVGAIDHTYGTRDLRRLSGLAREWPLLAVAGTLAAMSMAGLPILLGFVAKEAAFTTLLGPTTLLGWIALVAVVAGSVLTVAYSARFVWGAFARTSVRAATLATPGAPAPDEPPATRLHAPGRLLVGVPVLLAAAGLLLGPVSPLLETALAGHLAQWPAATGEPVHLGLWHGVNGPLLLSAATWLVGAMVFAGRRPVARAQARMHGRADAGQAYQGLMRGIDRLALEVTGALQRGSLPTLLATILLVLVLGPGIALLRGVTWPSQVLLFDTPAQLGVGLIVLAAAVAAVRARRRLRAVFLVGVVGYGVAMLFLLHGAPDLALTQVLVETVSLVIFVLVLRRLSGRFPDDPSRLTRRLRAGLGVAVGVVVAAVALTATAVRTATPSASGLDESAPSYGGGNNIVNVILVDVRAWDTMGELSVVLAAATGVASLVFLRREAVSKARDQLQASRSTRADVSPDTDQGRTRWLAAGYRMDPRRRSTIFEVVTRVVFHTLVLWSLYLLFSGHNNPGGGFAAGIVAGLALTLRYLAGRGYELRVAAPVMPGLLLGSGLFIAGGAAVLPMFFGSPALRTWIVDLSLPLVGDMHVVTSLLFDVGVYLVVIGLMLDILRSLGSALDEQIAEADDETDDELVGR